MGGGAWPFLVGGVICLVNSVNERDLNLLTSQAVPERSLTFNWLQQTLLLSARKGAETEFSIKLLHRGRPGDLTCPAILRARDGDNSLIQYGILQSFSYGSRFFSWRT